MKTISKRILIAFLVVMMTISGIAPSVMSSSRVVQASPEDTVSMSEPAEDGQDYSADSVPTVTPEITPAAEVTPEVTPEITPEVTPAVTPSVTPEITPAITPTATPEVTPEVTPTPALGFGLFSLTDSFTPYPVDEYMIMYEIDISDGKVTTISSTHITVAGETPVPYTLGLNQAIGVVGEGAGRIVVTNDTSPVAAPTLVLNGVNIKTPLGGRDSTDPI